MRERSAGAPDFLFWLFDMNVVRLVTRCSMPQEALVPRVGL